METAVHRAIRERAKYRCEYCHFPEKFAEVPFHCDHIIARQHGGVKEMDNLAFACCFCNRYKGPNLSGVDPESREVVRLFNPRADVWSEHFGWHGAHLLGLTSTGRATVHALRLNRADAVAVRQLLLKEREFPLD
jgi:hypothetical protein